MNGWPHFVLTSIPGVAVKAGDFLFADLGPRLFARLRQRLWQQAALRLVGTKYTVVAIHGRADAASLM